MNSTQRRDGPNQTCLLSLTFSPWSLHGWMSGVPSLPDLPQIIFFPPSVIRYITSPSLPESQLHPGEILQTSEY